MRRCSLFALPTQCWVCAAWPVFNPVCGSCLAQHAKAQRRCSTCALLLPDSAPAAQCGACVRQAPLLAACWSAVDYAAPWRDLVRRWKLAPQPALAAAAAQLMRAQLPLAALAQQADVLLPIPQRLNAHGSAAFTIPCYWRGLWLWICICPSTLQACCACPKCLGSTRPCVKDQSACARCAAHL